MSNTKHGELLLFGTYLYVLVSLIIITIIDIIIIIILFLSPQHGIDYYTHQIVSSLSQRQCSLSLLLSPFILLLHSTHHRVFAWQVG